MKLENEFTVAAPLDQTWDTLLDIERVATCLPGATIEPGGEDGVYHGAMRMKLGPMNVQYQGTARLQDVDEDSHTASIAVQAREAKGQGTAAAVISNSLEQVNGKTKVTAVTDLQITGRQAQFGRGIMEDVADRMLGEFAKRFEQELLSGDSPTPVAAPAAAPEPPAAERPAPDVLDMGSVIGGAPAARYAAGAAVAVAAVVVVGLLRRRGRRGVRIDFSYRW
jgi:uncharacterized protein